MLLKQLHFNRIYQEHIYRNRRKIYEHLLNYFFSCFTQNLINKSICYSKDNRSEKIIPVYSTSPKNKMKSRMVIIKNKLKRTQCIVILLFVFLSRISSKIVSSSVQLDTIGRRKIPGTKSRIARSKMHKMKVTTLRTKRSSLSFLMSYHIDVTLLNYGRSVKT